MSRPASHPYRLDARGSARAIADCDSKAFIVDLSPVRAHAGSGATRPAEDRWPSPAFLAGSRRRGLRPRRPPQDLLRRPESTVREEFVPRLFPVVPFASHNPIEEPPQMRRF